MRNPKILVVEDEDLLAEDIQKKLTDFGYDVPLTVSSGDEAIRKAGEMRPDLVLMDIMLKGNMDGIEAGSQIQTQFDIPVIYVTSYGDDYTLSRAKIAEPFGYVLKPFHASDIRINIEMALYKHKMEQKLRVAEKALSEANKRAEAHVRERNKELTKINEELRAEISKRKGVEELLTEAKLDAKAANVCQTELLQTMRHELRTPLNHIVGWARVLSDVGDRVLSEKQMECVKDILTSGQHLLDFINDILEASDVEAGKMSFKPAALSLRNLLQASISIIESLLKEPASIWPYPEKW